RRRRWWCLRPSIPPNSAHPALAPVFTRGRTHPFERVLRQAQDERVRGSGSRCGAGHETERGASTHLRSCCCSVRPEPVEGLCVLAPPSLVGRAGVGDRAGWFRVFSRGGTHPFGRVLRQLRTNGAGNRRG